MHIRRATKQDIDEVRQLHLQAFAEDEKEQVAKLAVNLLMEKTTPETFSLVADIDGTVVGHIAFSPVFFNNDENCLGYILAPLAVLPAHQHSHVGSALIEQGMQFLTEKGINLLFVYGDPKYYGRFGFSEEAANPFKAPYPLEYTFGWQAMLLNAIDDEIRPSEISCVNALSHSELW